MTPQPRISWEELAAIIHDAEAPVAVRLDGEVVVYIFYDPADGRLGLRVPVGAADLDPSPLVQVEVTRRQLDGGDIVEIATRTVMLFPYFHGFCLSVADRIQLDGLDANEAVNECVAGWTDLLRQATLLSPERQLGLIGELWLLSRLVARLGPAEALAAWTGPSQAAHDFRFGRFEVEVKTTRGERRVHVISGDTQLLASLGCKLYMLSLQFTAAGADAGESLASRVAAIRGQLTERPFVQLFDALLLASYGLDPSDLAHYSSTVKLRTPPYLVPVDADFPRLVLADLVGGDTLARVSDLRYRVDVEGLGFPAGSPQFDEVIGGPS
ncbi:MAG: PD-(D/E)XK motif protein [Acidimicrobiales bacterium]